MTKNSSVLITTLLTNFVEDLIYLSADSAYLIFTLISSVITSAD